MNRLRTLVAVAVIGLYALGTPSAMAAASGGVYCGYTNTNNTGLINRPGYYYLVLWRNGGYSGNCLGLWGNVSNLGQWSDGSNRSWNDVVSSYWFDPNDCHYGAIFYYNAGYDQSFLTLHGGAGHGGFGISENDAMSSLKIYVAPTCPG